MKKLLKRFFNFGLLMGMVGLKILFSQKLNAQRGKEVQKDQASHVIDTIETFNALREQIDRADQETLLILDVDYTLTQPSNPAFQQANFALNPQMVRDFVKSVPESVKREFASSILVLVPQERLFS